MDNMHKLKPNTTAYKNDYNKRNYVQFNVRIKTEINQQITNYCKEKGISKADFLVKCINLLDNSQGLDR